MHFTDQAIVLSARKHAESSAIVRVLMREHGLYAGMVRGNSSRANRGLWQPGNGVLVTWKARLAEHMGMLTGELLEPVVAHVLHDAARLAALSSACTLVEMAAPERHPYPQLYAALLHLVMALKDGLAWQEEYCRFELELLTSSGFRMDLSQCAATGGTENLTYVSPRSGRAVSREAGAPYHEKLLPLPAFLHVPEAGIPPDLAEILDSLRLTGYFLDAWLLSPHEKRFPAARGRLVNALHKQGATVEHETATG